ncbi:MAG: monofunctional biosynthetic peptidoglycan transglycosylase [Flavobacteriales bacterium]|nr:monofunctional biosynthetic peptidoglycan transglycosylase [Flavobacteriales bacterium]
MLRSILRWCAASAFWFVLISASWTALLGCVNPPVTWVMIEQARLAGSFKRVNRALEEMARAMPLAVISSEDQRFMTHSGFSWEQIQRAMEKNKRGKRVKGASTISQQTVKNVFLWPGRNYLRKGLEAWFTVLIEVLWTKERILEVYLNVAEMGRGVFGVEAAAQHCFGRTAMKLTPAQAALITATLPSPRRFSCIAPSGYVLGRQQWVLRQMRNVGDVLDPEVLARRKAKIESEKERQAERERKRRNRK